MHPDVEVVDLDPDVWGALADAVVQARASQPWVHVLHQGGRVLSVAGTSGGRGELPEVGAELGDPRRLCERLHASTGVARVVLIDRDHLAQIVKSVTGEARPGQTLAQLRHAVHQAYWSSPGVVTHPSPPRWPWALVAEVLANQPSPATGRVHVTRDGRVVMTLTLRIEDGLVTRISGSPEEEVDEPLYGVTLDWSGVASALQAPEPAMAFAALLLDSPHTPAVETLATTLLTHAAG
jgi:hypothetical protein